MGLLVSKSLIGKHCLCATIRFSICSLIVDFGGALLVVPVLLVTLVLRAPNPLNSQKPMSSYVSNFRLLVCPLHPFR